jgi:hypothetical protein
LNAAARGASDDPALTNPTTGILGSGCAYRRSQPPLASSVSSSLVDARGSVFGPLSKALIVLSDAQHCVFGFRIIHLIREIARFFCAVAPVIGLINEVARTYLKIADCCRSDINVE